MYRTFERERERVSPGVQERRTRAESGYKEGAGYPLSSCQDALCVRFLVAKMVYPSIQGLANSSCTRSETKF